MSFENDRPLDRTAKNQLISAARQLTLTRHSSMTCKTYELKVDKSHISEDTLETIKRLFLEAKWFYNNLVANGDFTHADYKIKVVSIRNKEGELEARQLKCLSSQMRQGIIERARDSFGALVRLKQRNRWVGRLRFKSRVGSIPLKQHGVTYRIRNGKVRIQNVKQYLRVNGLDQIPLGAELANATLEQKSGDYFIHVTTYQECARLVAAHDAIGVDGGVRHQLTLSNGVQIDEGVSLVKRIRRLHRELSMRQLRSKNWCKTRDKLEREYNHIRSHRNDIRRKIVSKLVSTYDSVAVQDDYVAGWQRVWGRRVNASAIGGIMNDLKTKSRTPVVVDRFERTTQKCSNCGSLRGISLEERVYRCDRCGFSVDRDLNAAVNLWKAVPAERRELTPVDTKAATELAGYFNSIPGVSASLVEETGSPFLATEAASMVAHFPR